MRAAFYLRVSTDQRTTENQRQALEAKAKAAGSDVVAVYDDNGVNGAKGREHHKLFNKLLRDAASGQFDIVAAWSVDRLGRSLQDLAAFLSELHSLRINLYLHQQGIDTTTPAGKAIFQMMGVFAEFEREMIRARVKAGMIRASAKGKHLGRPRKADAIADDVQRLHGDGHSNSAVARQLGVSEGRVRRILAA